MKDVARLEKARPEEGADKKKVGDAWMALAEKETSATGKKNAWKRAKFWYSQAVESLGGQAKASTEKELKKLDKLLPGEDGEGTAEAASSGSDFDKNLAKARLALRQTRFDVAVEILTDLVGKAPDEKGERNLRRMLDYAKAMQEGVSELAQGHFARAGQAFATALQILPGDPAAQYGMQLAQQGAKGAGNGVRQFKGGMPGRKGRG